MWKEYITLKKNFFNGGLHLDAHKFIWCNTREYRVNRCRCRWAGHFRIGDRWLEFYLWSFLFSQWNKKQCHQQREKKGIVYRNDDLGEWKNKITWAMQQHCMEVVFALKSAIVNLKWICWHAHICFTSHLLNFDAKEYKLQWQKHMVFVNHRTVSGTKYALEYMCTD